MPITKDELDEIVESPWQKLLDSMEKGKFYSLNEMAEKLVGRKIIGAKTRFFYLFRREKMVPKEEDVSSLALYLFDVSYVQSVLQSLVATRILKFGKKDGIHYYSKNT
jgi:hypothetical protein